MQTLETSSTMQRWSGTLDSLTTAVSQSNLRSIYQEKPITFHKTYQTKKPVKFPAVIRQAYAQIWSGKYQRVIIKAPRGGGKSKLIGTIGFDLWYFRRRTVVNMGGSLDQARIVYGYFTDYCDIESVSTTVAGKITMTKTEASEGHAFSCVTASPKQVRGKHPDVLLSDETCETSDELIDSALPMVNDSKHPLVVMASTFHKIFGRFAETWDNAVQRGYLRIQWDIFDIATPFTDEVWTRPEVRSVSGIDKLREYAKGRHGDPDGWVSIENIIQGWREKPTEDWFEVEYMGTRPSTAGLVLKPEDVDAAIFDSEIETRYNFLQGAISVLGIDWGFSGMTSVVELMSYTDQVVVMVDNKNFHQVAADEIITAVVKKVKEHGIRMIYADSAAKFENVALQNALNKERLGCTVIEVVFSKEKFGTPGAEGGIGMLGNLRAHFEQKKIKMPKKFVDAYYQLKNYRYQDGTDKPVKKNDHIPDGMMCGLQHFILGRFVRKLPTTTAESTKKQYDELGETRSNKTITAGLRNKIF